MLRITESAYSPKYSLDDILFKQTEPFDTGYLQVSGLHSVFYSQYGNPNGPPVVFVHGGPGAGTKPDHVRFFDPEFYRIVIFDQRGCGRSRPFGELKENTTQHLIEDMENLRIKLGIEKWLVFGGSWGSTLSMLYGEAYPDRCEGFILRGIYTGTKTEIDSLWIGNGDIFPEAHGALGELLPEEERSDVMTSYCKRCMDPDPAVYMPAIRDFIKYDTTIAFLLDGHKHVKDDLDDFALTLGLSRLCAHYSMNNNFLKDNQILDNLDKIAHLPAIIVQGRYDIICRAKTAYTLHKLWHASELVFVCDAGHAAMEIGTAKELVAATEKMKRRMGQ